MRFSFTKNILITCFAFLPISGFAQSDISQMPDPKNWDMVLNEAKGQSVYFNAWGGAPNINSYIAWVSDEVFAQYGIRLEHVKLSNTADAVNRVLAEKKAKRNQGGAIDLVWINGENFASMKNQNLLLEKGWSYDLPNYSLADIEGKKVLSYDFSEPVDGLESPWGTAQFSFYYDSAELSEVPTNLDGLAKWIKENPSRFTYADASNFIGNTFLKQLALGLIDDKSVFSKPVEEANFDKLTAPLWAWLDDIHPYLWRKGKIFARDTTHLKTLLSDNEISIAMTFNLGEASSAIKEGILPKTTRSFVLDYGSIGNAHFVTIPFNANAKAGAMVVANFMLSPIAQAKKLDENIWGDPSVLAYEKLSESDKVLFDDLTQGAATLGAEELGKLINEPDASWSEAFKKEWLKRYGAGG